MAQRQPDEDDDSQVVNLELKRLEAELEALEIRLDYVGEKGLNKLEKIRLYDLRQRVIRMTSATRTMIQLVPLMDEPEQFQPAQPSPTKRKQSKAAKPVALWVVALTAFVMLTALGLAVQTYLHPQPTGQTSGTK